MIENIYEQNSVTKLIFMFGIPSIISLMTEMLTGVVDTAFAGNLPEIGADALSAMALISPVLAIFTALQTLYAMSTGVLIAKYLNQIHRRQESYKTGIIMSIVVSAATSLICYFTLPKILIALGANKQIFMLAKQYLQIQLLSNVFSSIGYTLSCCIRAFGFPKAELKIITGAVVVNILLNFFFTSYFKMDLAGLALATLFSEIVCMLCCIIFLIKNNLWLCKSSLSSRVFFHTAYKLFKIGAAQTVIQMLGSLTGFAVNARLLTIGSMPHLAAWSVVQRIYSFALMPIVGLTQGAQSIISYYSGNGEQEKITKLSKQLLFLCSFYGAITLVLMLIFGQNLAAFFGGSYEILAIAKRILLVFFIGFPFVGSLYTDMTLLQVTEHEFASVLLILSRQVFFLIPLLYIFPDLLVFKQIGIPPIVALFFSMPIADLLSVLFAIFIKRHIHNCSQHTRRPIGFKI